MPRVVAELGLHRFLEADRLGGDDVHQRAALHSGKDDFVDRLRELGLGQNHPGARPAQRLVRRRSHNVRVRHRRRMRAAGDQSREMRHVDQKERADFVGDLAHAGEVDGARISAASANDQLRTLLLGQLFECIVVDRFRFFGHAVRNDLVGLAGKIEMMPVREVPAMRQVQAEDSVAGLQNGGISLHVGLRSRMRLHIGVLGAE